uniref:Uncharacterized protein n=1 Tax=Rhipicephalus zambeziensis TaxID=60191 RepID=A0A224Y5T3_9ACAR
MFSSSDCTLGYILLDTFRPHGGVVESDVLLPLHSTTTLQLHRTVRIYSTLYYNNNIVLRSCCDVIAESISPLFRRLTFVRLPGFHTQCRVLCVALKVVTVRSEVVGVCERNRQMRMRVGNFASARCVQGLLRARKSKLRDTLVENDMHRTFSVLFLVEAALKNER